MIAQTRLIYLTNLYNLFINLCAIKANTENHKQEAIQTPMIKYIELSPAKDVLKLPKINEPSIIA